jgi:two-component system LytT family response regulator
MKVTTLIADDEPVARAGLRDILASVEWISIVGEAANGASAVEMINRLRPELVLLDVEMPGLRGTDVLRHIEHVPFVIFTTAYAQHAVTAFELGALDYVLKPFGAARLYAALERARHAIGEPVSLPAFERFREAMASAPMSRLFVRSGDALIPVAVKDVIVFDADGDYVVAHTARSHHLVHVSLNRIEARLDPDRFVRIHRGHIVNLDHVRAFRRTMGRMIVEMTNGARLPVSRSKAQALRELAE